MDIKSSTLDNLKKTEIQGMNSICYHYPPNEILKVMTNDYYLSKAMQKKFVKHMSFNHPMVSSPKDLLYVDGNFAGYSSDELEGENLYKIVKASLGIPKHSPSFEDSFKFEELIIASYGFKDICKYFAKNKTEMYDVNCGNMFFMPDSKIKIIDQDKFIEHHFRRSDLYDKNILAINKGIDKVFVYIDVITYEKIKNEYNLSLKSDTYVEEYIDKLKEVLKREKGIVPITFKDVYERAEETYNSHMIKGKI